MGPEAVQKFINPEEVVKRLAASSGIDVLNLVRSMQEIQAEQQQAQQMAMQSQMQEQMAVAEADNLVSMADRNRAQAALNIAKTEAA